MAKLAKWQHILNLEAQAKGRPAPYSSNPDEVPHQPDNRQRQEPNASEKAIQQMASDVRFAKNVGLAVLIGKMVPGLFVLWLFYTIFWS